MALTTSLRLLLHPADEIDPASKSTYFITLYGGMMAIVIHIVFLATFKLSDVLPLYYFNYFSIATYLLSYYLVRVRNQYHAGMLLASLEILLHQGMAVYYLGWDYGFQYYLIASASFLFAGRFRNLRIPSAILLLSAVELIWLYFVGQHLYTHHYQMGETLRSILYIFNLSAAAFLITFFALVDELIRRDYERQLLATQEELVHAASTDELTGLFNRRRTQEQLEREMARVRRNGESFVVALGDIDNFKQINDNYGHDAGDIVLQQVAATMQRELREQDTVGRWGGEEFILLLPNTSMEGGLSAVDKVRQAVSSLPFSFDNKTLQVTMTFGVAASSPSSSTDRLTTQADRALYQGKHSSKNCVISATD